MAGIIVKTLAEGQLGTTAQGSLYTVPVGKATVVKNFRFANRDAASQSMNLYYLKSGLSNPSARRLVPGALSIPAAAMAVEDNELTMGAGDQIQGDASIAAKIDYVISGIERDA
jgi:hypothetical protein